MSIERGVPLAYGAKPEEKEKIKFVQVRRAESGFGFSDYNKLVSDERLRLSLDDVGVNVWDRKTDRKLYIIPFSNIEWVVFDVKGDDE